MPAGATVAGAGGGGGGRVANPDPHYFGSWIRRVTIWIRIRIKVKIKKL
jgi:hypothetical protein